MNTFFIILAANLASIIFATFAGYLAVINSDHWGWFMLASLISAVSGTIRTKD